MNSTLKTRAMSIQIEVCMKRRVVLTLETLDDRIGVTVALEDLFDFDAIMCRPDPNNKFYRLMELIGEHTCRRVLATQTNLPDGPVAPYELEIDDEQTCAELLELMNTGCFDVMGTYSALKLFT